MGFAVQRCRFAEKSHVAQHWPKTNDRLHQNRRVEIHKRFAFSSWTKEMNEFFILQFPVTFLLGSSYNGHWDGWYGPSGRKNYTFDPNLIMESPAAAALKSIGKPIPDLKTIESMRSQATIHCRKSKTDKTCNLSQQVCNINRSISFPAFLS